MSNIYASVGNRRQTPQSEPIPGRPEMVQNRAGGYVFQIDPWDQLDRFLILGTEGGTYYATERALTRENLGLVEALIAEDGPRVVQSIAAISDAGRAVRNTPATWALAACQVLGDEPTKAAANRTMPKIVRTGSHLFTWAECMKALGTGWGGGVKRAIGRWYLDRHPDSLRYQLTKYRQRNGWTHRDLLRLGHVGARGLTPKPISALSIDCPRCKQPAGKPCRTPSGSKVQAHTVRRKTLAEGAEQYRRLLGWVAGTQPITGDLESDDRLCAFVGLQQAGEGLAVADAVRLIERHRFTWEMLPTTVLKDAAVWEALLVEMPMWAMLRNLGRLSAVGLLKPMSSAERTVCERLRDAERVKNSRMHPAAVLQALKIYAQGRGLRGNLTWTPATGVRAALEDAFDLAFESVEPTGARTLLAVDGSGSMTGAWAMSKVAGLEALAPVEGAAAMAMALARREPVHHVVAFDTDTYQTNIHARTSLADAMREVSNRGGMTDGSAPIRWATTNRVEVDAFVIMTDNETWAGRMHPCQALAEYRQRMGIDARMVVVGMCATGHTFADPKDPLTMDVAGFDAAAPRVIADFCRRPNGV